MRAWISRVSASSAGELRSPAAGPVDREVQTVEERPTTTSAQIALRMSIMSASNAVVIEAVGASCRTLRFDVLVVTHDQAVLRYVEVRTATVSESGGGPQAPWPRLRMRPPSIT